MSRALLITGATGKQGGAVIDALLAPPPSSSSNPPNFLILAATRDATSPSAQRLAAKSPSIKLVQGDLDAAPALFAAARAAAADVPLWGVFSVQVPGKGDTETVQGNALVDEALKAGVGHFVYSSVDRGGEARSWENPTKIPHFITKHRIEHHLRDATASSSQMGWTILRPVAFMENLVPGFTSKLFLTVLRDTLGQRGKPLQWVATRDIGAYAALAFRDPQAWDRRAVSLAGDDLTFDQMSAVFEKVTGKPAGTTVGVLGRLLKWGVKEIGTMVDWFAEEGYGADIPKLRETTPELMDFETWLKHSVWAEKD